MNVEHFNLMELNSTLASLSQSSFTVDMYLFISVDHFSVGVY